MNIIIEKKDPHIFAYERDFYRKMCIYFFTHKKMANFNPMKQNFLKSN